MPINRRFKIDDLLEVAREFHQLRGYGVTFEYVLMDGVTDSDEDAVRLAQLTADVPCKINLIPYNELGSESDFRRPSQARLKAFTAHSKGPAPNLQCARAAVATSMQPVDSSSTIKRLRWQRIEAGAMNFRGHLICGALVGVGMAEGRSILPMQSEVTTRRGGLFLPRRLRSFLSSQISTQLPSHSAGFFAAYLLYCSI